MLILRPILKFLEICVLWIILPIIIAIFFSVILKSNVPLKLLTVYGSYLYISFILFLPDGTGFFEKYTPTAFLTKRFFINYKNKWGMTELQIKEYIKSCKKKEEEELKRLQYLKEEELKRIQYLKEEKRILAKASKKFVSPIIHRLCIMNLDAREAQEQFLKEVYPADNIEIHFLTSSNEYIKEISGLKEKYGDKIKEVFETEFTDSQFNEAIKYWKKKDFSDKKMFVNYLYKFTILADGIHKDEWNFMISLMSQLRFSKSFIEYFTYRYYALRTDFEDSKSKHGEEGSSTTEKSNTNLDSYYSILGVSSDASYEEVRKAYHSLALTHHPDLPKNAGRIQECEDLMIKFNEAYNKIIKN